MASTRAIALTAFNRPHYLKQVLQSFERNKTAGYSLHIGLEPGNPYVAQMCAAGLSMPTIIHRNPSRLGIRANPYTLLHTMFSSGITEVVYCEDDVVLSPDALSLANWYFQTFEPGRYLYLNLFTYTSDPAKPTDIYESKASSSLGLVITKKSWETWMAKHWFDDKFSLGYKLSIGWDYCMTAVLKHYDIKTLIPAFSRSNHIGREGGIHCSKQWHDQAFSKLQWNQDPNATNYQLQVSA